MLASNRGFWPGMGNNSLIYKIQIYYDVGKLVRYLGAAIGL